MLNKERNIDSEGNDNINNTGDHPHFGDRYYFNQQPLNRSYLYNFCVEFAKVEIEYEYITKFTSRIDDKIIYNEIAIYKEIFQNIDHHYDDVELILNEILGREKIVARINLIYTKSKGFDKWDNKDQLCQLVYEKLYKTVENDKNSSNIVIEDVEIAIHSLMYYAFVKCKLLDPVPLKEK